MLSQVTLHRRCIVTLAALEVPLFLVNTLYVAGQVTFHCRSVVALVALEVPLLLMDTSDVAGGNCIKIGLPGKSIL